MWEGWAGDRSPYPDLGHGLSIGIGIVVGLFWLARASIPKRPLRYGAAAMLFGFALYRLIRSRHPNWVGMRVGFRDLTLWSFLMASAHGAGLILVPVLLAWPQVHAADVSGRGAHGSHSGHIAQLHMPAASGPLQGLAAVGMHTWDTSPSQR